MKRILGITTPLLFVIALIYFMIIGELSGQWSGARVVGVLSVILTLFSIWRKSKGVSAILWSLLIVVSAWMCLWLYPAGVVSNGVLFLLAFVVSVLSVWEVYKGSVPRRQ